MSAAPRKSGPVVRIYRKGLDTLDDLVFVFLLVFVLLGFSVRLLARCLK